jgi:hypothetical protein
MVAMDATAIRILADLSFPSEILLIKETTTSLEAGRAS